MKFKSGFDKAGTAGFGSSMIIRQGDLQFDIPYKFRILMPVIPFKPVFYPAMVQDEETGGWKQSYRVVRLPLEYSELGWKKEPNVFSELKDIDLRIRKSKRSVGGVDKGELKSEFDPISRWAFPVLDRRDSSPIVRILEVGWTIFKELRDIENSRYSDSVGKLSHGPVWIWDVVITKKRKDTRMKLKDKFNVEYSVRPKESNPWAGKFSPDYIDPKDKKLQEELFEHSVKMGILTSDEKFVIDTFDFDVDFINKYSPMSNERMLKMLGDNPLCLDATSLDGDRPIFPDPKAFAQELIKLEINYGLISSDFEHDQLSAPSKGEEVKKDVPAAKVDVAKAEKGKVEKDAPVASNKEQGKDLPEHLKGLSGEGKSEKVKKDAPTVGKDEDSSKESEEKDDEELPDFLKNLKRGG